MLRSAPHPNAHHYGERITTVAFNQSGNDADSVKVIDFAGVQMEVGGLTLMVFIHKIQWAWLAPLTFQPALISNTNLFRDCMWYAGTESTSTSLTAPPSTLRDYLCNDTLIVPVSTSHAFYVGGPARGTVHYTPAIALATGKMTVRITSGGTATQNNIVMIIHYTFEHKGADEFLAAFVNQTLKTA